MILKVVSASRPLMTAFTSFYGNFFVLNEKKKTKHVSPLIWCRKIFKPVQGNPNPGPNYGLECSQTNHWKDRKAPLSTLLRTSLPPSFSISPLPLFGFCFIVLGFFLLSVAFSEFRWRWRSRLQRLCGQSSSASHSLLEVSNIFEPYFA